ncbi:MAG: hypothetical protein ABI763_09350 [Bacteroidota bacterium]
MNLLKNISFGILLVAFTSCHKDSPIDSNTPTIELESISSNNIDEGDPLTFRIKYTDGDGDLGENNADAHNLFLVDNRVNVIYEYRIQELAPPGSSLIITGHLDVELKTTAITNGSNSQSVTYSIYVKDRAGNQSNTVTTESITINK